MADLKDWRSYSEIDPELDATLKAIGPFREFHDFPSINAVREYLKAGRGRVTDHFGRPPGVKEVDYQVKMRDGAEVTCRVHSPEQAPSKGSPLVIVYHGGGYALGGLSSEELLCRHLASYLHLTVVNADYRLAPEHKFPTAINDAYDIAQWALSQASTLGADPSKDFLLSGSSAGGCLATVTALRLRDEKISPPVTGLHLMVPLLCYPPALPEKYKPFDHAITQNAEAPILNTSGMKFFFDHYIPNESDRYTELFSPFLWKSGFKNFPRTYFQIAGMDALRDQELLFERRLREEEHVETRVDLYQGVPHGFYTAFPKLGASARFVRDWVPGFEWLLK